MKSENVLALGNVYLGSKTWTLNNIISNLSYHIFSIVRKE